MTPNDMLQQTLAVVSRLATPSRPPTASAAEVWRLASLKVGSSMKRMIIGLSLLVVVGPAAGDDKACGSDEATRELAGQGIYAVDTTELLNVPEGTGVEFVQVVGEDVTPLWSLYLRENAPVHIQILPEIGMIRFSTLGACSSAGSTSIVGYYIASFPCNICSFRTPPETLVAKEVNEHGIVLLEEVFGWRPLKNRAYLAVRRSER